MAFLFGAYNLKDYLSLHEIDWPKHGPELALDVLNDGGTGVAAASADATNLQPATQSHSSGPTPAKEGRGGPPVEFRRQNPGL